MTLAAAFRRNSGADRYPDLGRLSCGHISLVDGRFGGLPPKERWWLDFVSDNRSMGGHRRMLGRCWCLHERVPRRGRYLAPGRNQNWIKSRPLAMTRSKVDPPCRRRWRGSRSERPTAPGMAVFRFRWCRFRGQCCTRGYARGRALGVGQSAAAPWLSSSHSSPAVFPHSAILTSCRRR